MTLAAAAILLTGPTLADDNCLAGSSGVHCDLFLDAYRSNEVPVETSDLWAADEFVVERHQDLGPDSGIEFPGGDDVLYWDGDSAMIVPEDTGPRLEIADW